MFDWFKKRNKDWPSKQPVWTLTVLALALALWAALTWNSLQAWTPLQRYWFMPYLWTSWTNHRDMVLRMVLIERRNGELNWPTNDTTVPGRTRTTDGKIIPFCLIDDLYAEGARLVVYPKYKASTAYLRDVFQNYAYNGLTLHTSTGCSRI